MIATIALARVASAGSIVFDVTPQNVEKHHIIVRTTFQQADSTVAFSVGISTRVADRSGFLQIWQTAAGVETVQDGTGRRVHLSGREAGCEVAEQLFEDKTWFSFQLRHEIAKRATFQIFLDHPDPPSYTGFELRMRDFWPE
jgi:hypothetical protein